MYDHISEHFSDKIEENDIHARFTTLCSIPACDDIVIPSTRYLVARPAKILSYLCPVS
jgi:hypothetical protein